MNSTLLSYSWARKKGISVLFFMTKSFIKTSGSVGKCYFFLSFLFFWMLWINSVARVFDNCWSFVVRVFTREFNCSVFSRLLPGWKVKSMILGFEFAIWAYIASLEEIGATSGEMLLLLSFFIWRCTWTVTSLSLHIDMYRYG